MTPKPDFSRYGRELAPNQTSQLVAIDIASAEQAIVFEADEIIEAPNWTPDGETLIFNAGGEIWRIDAMGKTVPERIDTGRLRDLNNDHVVSPNGQTLYVSSNDGHLYSVPATGGEPVRVSNQHDTPFHYYLHGISPDGETLAYVAVEGKGEGRRINIFTIPANGGPDTRLTDLAKPHDGPEYSPDGKWIYFNSERASELSGHSQLFRMRPDGSGVEQFTFDERVNWFPHPSPDGRQIVYLSYPEGTLGHPHQYQLRRQLSGHERRDQRL